jgi:hypothetical protein
LDAVDADAVGKVTGAVDADAVGEDTGAVDVDAVGKVMGAAMGDQGSGRGHGMPVQKKKKKTHLIFLVSVSGAIGTHVVGHHYRSSSSLGG